MYKYQYVISPPEEGFYWLMLQNGSTLGIYSTNDILVKHTWDDLHNQFPDITFCGPIPLPNNNKIGRSSVKARADKPIKS